MSGLPDPVPALARKHCRYLHRDDLLPCQGCKIILGAVREALEDERRLVLSYLRETLAKNHPHLSDAYEHAAKNLEAKAHTIGVAIAALRGGTGS